jgi:hypothetical protein
VRGTFRSLNSPDYRVWAGGALVSNVGTWMQRTAQDWLVLTQLAVDKACIFMQDARKFMHRV